MSDHLRALLAVYDRIPVVACRRLCSDSCTIAPYSSLEGSRMLAYSGKRSIGHPEHVMRALGRAQSAEELAALMPACPLLRREACTVHPVRPLICRLYGASEDLPCPHGCEVTPRPLTSEETRALVREVGDIADAWEAGR